MKQLTYTVVALLIASSFYSVSASADHVALVYCEQDPLTDESHVVTFDMNIFSKKPMIGKVGQSCSETLHELMKAGYEIHTIKSLPIGQTGERMTKETKRISSIARGQIVFVMTAAHTHK
jgi:hypothetical protein